MKNAVIIDFSLPHTQNAILRLEEEKLISIKFWLGFFQEKIGPHIIQGYDNGIELYHYNDVYCEAKYYNEVYKHIGTFINITNRWYMTLETYTYIHFFNLYINYWYRVFKKHQISMVIFGNIPHGGLQYVAYLLAKAMKIDTLCVMTTIFPGKFLCCKTIENIGKNEFGYLGIWEYTKLEKTYKKELYYMKKIEPTLLATRISLDETFKKVFRKNKSQIKSLLVRYKGLGIRKLGEIIGYQLITSYLNKRYDSYLKEYTFSVFDANVKYVYFPLHLQPEMTTDILGGIFEDQILAIERIAELVPKDWFIYVKDNPKQSYFKRNETFFRRLLSVKKVRLVSYEVNTYDLIEKSQFVATITGTAGWEAITGGKNVLIFGYAWYRTFPGVFEYYDKINLDDILQYQISHEELEENYNQFMCSLFDGVVATENMEKLDPDYSISGNNTKVFHSLKTCIMNYNTLNESEIKDD